MKFTSSIKLWAKTHAILPLVIGAGSAAFLASCKKNFVTITWKNDDGTVLEVDEKVKKGTMPTYDGETPTKTDTAKDHFTFDKWSPEVVEATESTEYTATFTSELRKYTVTWKNADGTVLEKDENVPFGTTAEYNSATPTQASSNTKVFTFNTWDKTPGAVEGDVEYTATYNETDRYYNVKFLDHDDTELYNENHLYNDVIDDSSFIPSRDATSDTAYDFIGWDNEVVPVCEDNTVYHATYQSSHLTFALVSGTHYIVTGLIDPNYEGEIHIPATWGGKPVKTINDEAFKDNTKITSVTFDENSNLTYIGYRAFYNTRIVSATVKGDGLDIGQEAFKNCFNLKTLTLEGVKRIRSSAFEYCRSIEELELPASLDEYESTSVETYAFGECWSLYLVTLKCGRTKLVDNSFYGCGSVTEVIVPRDYGEYGTYGKLGTYTFKWLNTVDDIQNKRGTFEKEDGEAAGERGRVYYTPHNSTTKYLVSSYGEGTTLKTGSADEIKEYAFFTNTYIQTVVISKSITRINNFAFDYCRSITSFTFEMGGETPLDYIGQSATREVPHIGEFILPARAKNCNFSQYALNSLPNVTAFSFENDEAAYNSCVDGVLYTNYGKMLFNYPEASTVTDFEVSKGVIELNGYVGIRNNNLQTLHFAADSTTTSEEHPLKLWEGVVQGSSITSITFESDVVLDIHWYPFRGCSSLRKLVLPANTHCRARVLNGIGTQEDKPCDVFFAGTAEKVATWRTTDDYNGPWYKDKGAYCNIYLYSEDAMIPAGDLPDNFNGSWHYVSSVPTIWSE